MCNSLSGEMTSTRPTLPTCVFSEAKRVATRVAPSETTKLSSESSVTPAAAWNAVMLAIVACQR